MSTPASVAPGVIVGVLSVPEPVPVSLFIKNCAGNPSHCLDFPEIVPIHLPQSPRKDWHHACLSLDMLDRPASAGDQEIGDDQPVTF